jgi:hypothetical protein
MVEFFNADDFEIAVSKARTDAVTDFYIETSDVLDMSTTEKSGEPRNTGNLTVDNRSAKYTSGDKPLHLKDKLVLQVQNNPGAEFGAGPFGAGPFSGWEQEASFMITNVTRNREQARPTEVELRLTGFANGILSDRDVDFTETNRPISGSAGAILNQVLRDNAPEIGRQALPKLDERIDFFVKGVQANKVIGQIADRAAQFYGPIIWYGEGGSLRFKQIRDLDYRLSEPVGPADFAGEAVEETTDRGLVNNVRVVGGIDDENNETDAQRTVDDTVTVSDTNRLTTPIATRKSEISSFEIYTKKRSDSPPADDPDANGVRARIQIGKQDGSGPIEPGDTDSDIIGSGERKVAYDDDGFTTFRLAEHKIPDREIWLIVDTESGDSAFDIGVQTDANGNPTDPAYVAYFPKPVGVEKPLNESINKYRRVDGRIVNEGLESGAAVRDTADAKLARSGYPPSQFQPEYLDSERVVNLDIGDKVKIEGYENIMVHGDYVVTEKKRDYDGFKIYTELGFEGVQF